MYNNLDNFVLIRKLQVVLDTNPINISVKKGFPETNTEDGNRTLHENLVGSLRHLFKTGKLH